MSARLYAAQHPFTIVAATDITSNPVEGLAAVEAEEQATVGRGHLTLAAVNGRIIKTPPAPPATAGGLTNRNGGGFDACPKHAA